MSHVYVSQEIHHKLSEQLPRNDQNNKIICIQFCARNSGIRRKQGTRKASAGYVLGFTWNVSAQLSSVMLAYNRKWDGT